MAGAPRHGRAVRADDLAAAPRLTVRKRIYSRLYGVTNAAPNETNRGEDNLSGAVERYLTRYFSGFDDGLPPPGLYHRILREVEAPLLSAALAATRGNQIRAADLLGVNRNTLRKKIRDLEIQVYRSGGG
jgi:DNA-binding protein Fis